MQKWIWAAAPLAMGMSVAACNGADRNDDKAAPQNGADRVVAAGPQATQNYALADFSAVEVTGPDDVTIRQGNSFSITAKGPQAVIDRLEIERSGDRLSIGRKRGNFSFSGDGDADVEIAITMPRLSAVRLTGSGTVDADKVEGEAVELAVTGSGDLKIASLTGQRADVAVSGSGDVAIDGGTITAGELRITGSGDIDADDLAAETLEISVTGSGNVDARASGTAEVSILGSGDVELQGGATCSSRQLGSGTVTCR